jgi:hypothetical protein
MVATRIFHNLPPTPKSNLRIELIDNQNNYTTYLYQPLLSIFLYNKTVDIEISTHDAFLE